MVKIVIEQEAMLIIGLISCLVNGNPMEYFLIIIIIITRFLNIDIMVFWILLETLKFYIKLTINKIIVPIFHRRIKDRLNIRVRHLTVYPDF